jgi:hypothetical protein
MDFFDRVELLSSFLLFVEETGVFIPILEPEAPGFLSPIVLLLSASKMEISMQLVFLFQRNGVHGKDLRLELMLFQGLLHFQTLLEGGFKRFGPGFESQFKFSQLFFPDEERRARD